MTDRHIEAGIIKIDLIGYRWVVIDDSYKRSGWTFTKKQAEAKRDQALEEIQSS